jgi:hypothetical protein
MSAITVVVAWYVAHAHASNVAHAVLGLSKASHPVVVLLKETVCGSVRRAINVILTMDVFQALVILILNDVQD